MSTGRLVQNADREKGTPWMTSFEVEEVCWTDGSPALRDIRATDVCLWPIRMDAELVTSTLHIAVNPTPCQSSNKWFLTIGYAAKEELSELDNWNET